MKIAPTGRESNVARATSSPAHIRDSNSDANATVWLERIIKQVARETCAFEIKRWKEKEQASEKIVRAHGNTIVELTQAQYEEFQNAMAPLYEEYGSAYMSTINAIKSTN